MVVVRRNPMNNQEIRDNLIARIVEAEREGWLGEIEGLRVSVAGAEDKLAQIDRCSGTAQPSTSASPPSNQAPTDDIMFADSASRRITLLDALGPETQRLGPTPFGQPVARRRKALSRLQRRTEVRLGYSHYVKPAVNSCVAGRLDRRLNVPGRSPAQVPGTTPREPHPRPELHLVHLRNLGGHHDPEHAGKLDATNSLEAESTITILVLADAQEVGQPAKPSIGLSQKLLDGPRISQRREHPAHIAVCEQSDLVVHAHEYGSQPSCAYQSISIRAKFREACTCCPMLDPSPKTLDRLAEPEVVLTARRKCAEEENWRGEIEGIDLILRFLRAKREEAQ